LAAGRKLGGTHAAHRLSIHLTTLHTAIEVLDIAKRI
jgi:hypothetical protein